MEASQACVIADNMQQLTYFKWVEALNFHFVSCNCYTFAANFLII